MLLLTVIILIQCFARSYKYLRSHSKFTHLIFLVSYKIPLKTQNLLSYLNVMHVIFIGAFQIRLYSSLMLFFKILGCDQRKRYSISRSLILVIWRFYNETRWNFLRSLKNDLNGAKYTTNSLHHRRYSRRAVINIWAAY